jgi:hypothetical protein
MYANLSDILLTDGAQQKLAADCQGLVEQELSGKSGISAAAVKMAYKAVTSFAPGYYQMTVESMIPDLLRELQPFWADFQAAGGGTFGDYLVKREDEVEVAMLRVTDHMAATSERTVLIKAYGAVRGSAGKNIAAALPSVGTLVENYAA